MSAPRIAPEDKDWWLDDVESTYAWLRAEAPVHRFREGHRIRALALATLDSAPTEPEIDFVEDVAVPLPLAVIAELLGMSHVGQDQFRVWSDEAIRAADGLDADLGVVGEFVRAMHDAIREHRTRARDDVLQQLVDAEVDGERLTDDELLVFCMSLLVAGNETTRNLITGGALALHFAPGQRAWLATDPSARVPDAVEELLRWVTPIKAFARTATEDLELAGSRVAAGDYLVLLYASGNRDEAAFGPTAGRLDVRRRPDPAHVAFGFGAHLCLGASLARLEARVLFEEVLERWPQYEITGEPTRLRSTLVNGIERLPAVLGAASSARAR